MKLQTEFDLRGGAIESVVIEPGRASDGATSRQFVRRGAGTLRIADLGYFSPAVFAAMALAGELFLSRLSTVVHVFDAAGAKLDLLATLAAADGIVCDRPVQVGAAERLCCRLIAWRMPPEVAARRRQKLIARTRDKKGRTPSRERLAWCDWTVLVTNVEADRLTPAEAAVLYRARWQIELLFKRWKSQGLVAQLHGATATQQLVRVWARLLAALVQHWLLLGAAWGDPAASLSKVCQALRTFAVRVARLLPRFDELVGEFEHLRRVLAATCRRDKRRQPGTFELLNHPRRLNYGLT